MTSIMLYGAKEAVYSVTNLILGKYRSDSLTWLSLHIFQAGLRLTVVVPSYLAEPETKKVMSDTFLRALTIDCDSSAMPIFHQTPESLFLKT